MSCGLLRLEDSFLSQRGPHGYNFWIIYQQQHDGRAANRTQCFQSRTVPDKVLRPHIAAGIEQANDLAAVRIDPGNIRPLESITVDTGKGKIL